jgi:TPR repeat protein
MVPSNSCNDAKLAIGTCLVNGWGCKVDLDAAAIHFKDAQKSGVKTARRHLGKLYLRKKEWSHALRWFEEAMAAGEVTEEEFQLCKVRTQNVS